MHPVLAQQSLQYALSVLAAVAEGQSHFCRSLFDSDTKLET